MPPENTAIPTFFKTQDNLADQPLFKEWYVYAVMSGFSTMEALDAKAFKNGVDGQLVFKEQLKYGAPVIRIQDVHESAETHGRYALVHADCAGNHCGFKAMAWCKVDGAGIPTGELIAAFPGVDTGSPYRNRDFLAAATTPLRAEGSPQIRGVPAFLAEVEKKLRVRGWTDKITGIKIAGDSLGTQNAIHALKHLRLGRYALGRENATIEGRVSETYSLDLGLWLNARWMAQEALAYKAGGYNGENAQADSVFRRILAAAENTGTLAEQYEAMLISAADILKEGGVAMHVKPSTIVERMYKAFRFIEGEHPTGGMETNLLLAASPEYLARRDYGTTQADTLLHSNGHKAKLLAEGDAVIVDQSDPRFIEDFPHKTYPDYREPTTKEIVTRERLSPTQALLYGIAYNARLVADELTQVRGEFEKQVALHNLTAIEHNLVSISTIRQMLQEAAARAFGARQAPVLSSKFVDALKARREAPLDSSHQAL